jgi:hypothetical protein
LNATRGTDICIFNQFDEMGNHLWHYEVTGHAMEEVINKFIAKGDRYSGLVVTTGSAGTIAAGDYLKKVYPTSKIAGCEALQCPTLIYNGFGAHRIEGIGDKHVPWVHNVKNTDMIIAIDDEDCMGLLRLFNEPTGRELLKKNGVPAELVDKLDLIGISGIANIIASIKYAKYYELTSKDVVMTVLTDSAVMYQSRIRELNEERGAFTDVDAAVTFNVSLKNLKIDHVDELSYIDRKRVHNLKYYTWVEQQGKTVEELNRQWYDDNYWDSIVESTPAIDKLIDEFNKKTGVFDTL